MLFAISRDGPEFFFQIFVSFFRNCILLDTVFAQEQPTLAVQPKSERSLSLAPSVVFAWVNTICYILSNGALTPSPAQVWLRTENYDKEVFQGLCSKDSSKVLKSSKEEPLKWFQEK